MVCIIVNCNYLAAWILMTFVGFMKLPSIYKQSYWEREKNPLFFVFAIGSSIKCSTFRLVWLDYCWFLRTVPFTDPWILLHCCSFVMGHWGWTIYREQHGFSSETRVSHEPELQSQANKMIKKKKKHSLKSLSSKVNIKKWHLQPIVTMKIDMFPVETEFSKRIDFKPLSAEFLVKFTRILYYANIVLKFTDCSYHQIGQFKARKCPLP